ncbi:MAG: phage tail tape measure protein [Oscillospiraceae bacterium]
MNGLGIALRSSNSEFRNMGDVLDEVGQKWSSLNSVQQASLSVAMAGTRQQNKFRVLMENYTKALAEEERAMNSSGTAMEKFSAYEESVEAKTNKAAAAFEKFSSSLLDSNIIGGFMDFGTAAFNALSAFDAWPAKIALIVAAIATLKGVFSTLKGMNLFQNIANSFSGLAERIVMIGPSNWIIAAGQCKEAA